MSTPCETPLPASFYDACIETWFTAWHPLFPIINKEDMIDIGERSMVNNIQRHLIVSITSRSSLNPSAPLLVFCENMWQGALDEMMMDTTMDVLHCIMLALVYSLLRGDGDKCQYYKGVADVIYHYIRLLIYFSALEADGHHKYLAALAVLEMSSWHICQALNVMEIDDIHFPLFLDKNHLRAICTHVQKHPAIIRAWCHEPRPMTASHVRDDPRLKERPENDHVALKIPDVKDDAFAHVSTQGVQGSAQHYAKSDWDVFVGTLDRGSNNIHERIYGGNG
ncbi:Transcriptional activator protein acu-15 [Fusarium sp. Ph1]|nr:Transcriptional activator protein acu-15 [Fusarium sp. Ph1]